MPFQKGNQLAKGAMRDKMVISGQKFEELGSFILGDGMTKAIAALDEISETDKKAYLDKLINLLEYFKPKLARTDITSDGKPIDLFGATHKEITK